MSRPIRTIGLATSIVEILAPASFSSSKYEPKSDVAAMTAVAMAKPFVMAFVVLPTASRSAMVFFVFSSPSFDISIMPLALSATGPKVSIETTTPVVVSIPIPASEME